MSWSFKKDLHSIMYISVRYKGSNAWTTTLYFLFYSLRLSWYSSEPEPPGAQRTALWVLHSRAKQLHWTVTDFPGDGCPTNKGHPHEWMNKALMRHWKSGTSAKTTVNKGEINYIIVSKPTVRDYMDLLCSNTHLTIFSGLWSAPNLKKSVFSEACVLE